MEGNRIEMALHHLVGFFCHHLPLGHISSELLVDFAPKNLPSVILFTSNQYYISESQNCGVMKFVRITFKSHQL